MARRAYQLSICLIWLLSVTLIGQQTVNVGLTAFNGGELSPLMMGRVDYGKYEQGLRRCENLLPTAQGPVTRRPGTRYVATSKNSQTVRLLPFEYSLDDTYIIEAGNRYLRFYRQGAQVLDPNGDPYEIVTPFDTSEIAHLQYVQSANTMYLVDGNDPVQALTRTGHTAWTIADVNFTTGPFIPRDAGNQITLASDDVNGVVTLTASAPLFQSGHVGSIWKIYHKRIQNEVTGSFSVTPPEPNMLDIFQRLVNLIRNGQIGSTGTMESNGTSDPVLVSGAYNVTSHGTWSGTLSLQRSVDGGDSWEVVQTVVSANDNNMNTSDVETTPGALYRLAMTNWTSGKMTYIISIVNYYDYGVAKITAVTDPCTATAMILDDLVSTEPTAIWQEGYWSDYRGWPRALAFHEQRLWFGGSTTYPQTLWSSQTAEAEGDYEDMTTGTEDDGALIYTLPGKNLIRWLYSQSYLMVATAGGVGRLGMLDQGMTPTNIQYRLQTTSAAAPIQPVSVGDVLLYVERGGRKVRQYLYNYEADQFIAPDVSILAEHISATGLTGMAIQRSPQVIVWCTRADGQLVTMTYLREEQVTAWARQLTDGRVECIATLPAEDEDEVWFSVARTIYGTEVHYIEQLQPHDWGADPNDCWFVDSGLSFDGGPAVRVTNVTQADPAQVTVWTWPVDGDGVDLANGDQVRFTEVGGMIDLNGNVFTVADANVTAGTFTLRDDANSVAITSTVYSPFTTGGYVQRVENTFAGLEHLEGKTLAVWADSTVRPEVQVSYGSTTLDGWYNRVVEGLPYTSTLETMPLLIRTDAGPMLRAQKRIIVIGADFYQTIGPTMAGDEIHLTPVVKQDAISEAVPELYSEWREINNLEGGWSRTPTVWIRQSDPAPMTVRQIEADVRIGR